MKKASLIPFFKSRFFSKKGFTLSELLIVLAIMSLIGAAIGIGLSTAAATYRNIRTSSESAILCGTLSSELADTLRFAENISQSGGRAVFTHRRYGIDVAVDTDENGHITIGGYQVLSEKAYTDMVTDADVTYDGDRFHIVIFVFQNSITLATAEFVVTPVIN